MIVSHEHRFIFLKTKKTAGTSVEIALSRVCGEQDVLTPLSEDDEKLRAAVGGRPAQHFGVPPLREAVWQHSAAQAARKAVGREVWDDYRTFVIERNPWDAVVSLYYYVVRHGRQVTFEQFLHKPQVSRLARQNYRSWHINGERVVDVVLRYETLSDDLSALWADLGLPGSPDLPGAKTGIRPGGVPYRELYDDAGRELVGDLFSRVVDELGYAF